MIHDSECRAMLASVFAEIKELAEATSHLQDQVASLRDVLKEAGPKFAELFDARLKFWQSQTTAVRAQTNAIYDQTIRKLRES